MFDRNIGSKTNKQTNKNREREAVVEACNRWERQILSQVVLGQKIVSIYVLEFSVKGLASHVQAKKNITRTFLIWVQLGPVDCLFIRTLQPSLHPNPIKSTIKS